MSSKWPQEQLSNLVKIKGGKRLPAGKSLQQEPNSHPYIRVRDVGQRELPRIGLEYVPDEIFPSISRYIVEPNDVVLSIVGTIGALSIVDAQYNHASLTENCVKLHGLDHDDALYLYYYLASSAGQQEIYRGTVGAVQPKLPIYNIEKIGVAWPDRQIREVVSKVLGVLDDRIALLRETNATLEAIAQALFKSWFIDFEPVRAKMEGRAPEGMDETTAALFPDSFEESELGLVPRGWRVGVLGDVLALRNERIKPSEVTQALPYVPIESISAKVPFLQEYKSGEEANSSLILFHKGDILFGAMRPYFHKVCAAPFNGVTRTTVFALQAKNPMAFGYALFLVFQEATIEYATLHSEGSTIPYAKWGKSLEYMPVILPPDSIQIGYGEIVSSFIERANENIKQVQTLANLRDTLLPRLISGQLRLSEVQSA